jgi:hypothetical protein
LIRHDTAAFTEARRRLPSSYAINAERPVELMNRMRSTRLGEMQS